MKENRSIIKDKDMEYCIIEMEKDMKENGEMI